MKNGKKSAAKKTDPFYDWIGTLNSIAQNPTPENNLLLKKYFFSRELGPFDKFSFSKYAARVFLFFGKSGIDDLVSLFQNDETSPKHTNAILGTLFFATKKQCFDAGVAPKEKERLLTPLIPDDLAKYSEKKLFDLISISMQNPFFFDKIIDFLSFCQIPRTDCNNHELIAELFSLLRDSTLQINGIIIENFRKMIENDALREEEFQDFLANNTVLIDPLAKEILPKHRLGDEYITDFVIQKLNDEYLLVEIEKPQDKIFTKSNDFTALFTHALGQVIDFQEWVESNIAYAQTKLPNVISPTGIIIMGRSSDLNVTQKKKLKRLIINMNGRLKVFTYDDVLENANKLLKNMISQ